MKAKWKENTVEVVIRRDAPKMSPNEVFTFLETVLKINPLEDLRCLQQETRRRVMSLTLSSAELCERVLLLDDGELKFTYLNGFSTDVSLRHAGLNGLAVRINDLPYGMPHAAVVEALKQFGEPIGDMNFDCWIRDGKRTAISNGVRVVRMNLSMHVPSYLTVAGFRAAVFYAGQPKTCARCGSTGHLVKFCTVQPRQRTFAAAAGGVVEEEPEDVHHVSIPDGGEQRLVNSEPKSTGRAGQGTDQPRAAINFCLETNNQESSSEHSAGPVAKNQHGSVEELLSAGSATRVQDPDSSDIQKLLDKWSAEREEEDRIRAGEESRKTFNEVRIGLEEETLELLRRYREKSEHNEDMPVEKEISPSTSTPAGKNADRTLSLNLEDDIGNWEMAVGNPELEDSWASASATPTNETPNGLSTQSTPGVADLNAHPLADAGDPTKNTAGARPRRNSLQLPTAPSLSQRLAKSLRTGNVNHVTNALKTKKRSRTSPDQDASTSKRDQSKKSKLPGRQTKKH